MCTFSDPLPSPEPQYDAGRDVIMCKVTPKFGDHAWQLPATQVRVWNRDTRSGGLQTH